MIFCQLKFTNLSRRVFQGGVVSAPGRDGVSVLDFFDLLHRIKRLRLLRIAAGDLLDLAVAELVAGDHGRQAVSVSPENVSLTLQF